MNIGVVKGELLVHDHSPLLRSLRGARRCSKIRDGCLRGGSRRHQAPDVRCRRPAGRPDLASRAPFQARTLRGHGRDIFRVQNGRTVSSACSACASATRHRSPFPRGVPMSIWQDHSIEARFRDILASVPDEGHHFGRPFLSAYQIAIAFDQQFRARGEPDRQAGRRQGHRTPRLPGQVFRQPALPAHPRRHAARHRGPLSQRAVPRVSGVRQRWRNRRLLPRRGGPLDLPSRPALTAE